MSAYTGFRDKIRNLPDIHRHFLFAGMGLTSTGIIAAGAPEWAPVIPAALALNELSKKDVELVTGIRPPHAIDVIKNIGSFAAPLLLASAFGIIDAGSENEPTGATLDQTPIAQAESAFRHVPSVSPSLPSAHI